MLSNPLLKVKLPYAKEDADIKDAFNYTVKTINGSKVLQPSSITDLGVTFDYVLDAGSSALLADVTFSHGIGSNPSGWLVIDSVFPVASGAYATFTRLSWTKNDITIRINIHTGSAALIVGSLKILVLR